MYRDSFESCPRCKIALSDAGAVRACEQCGGQWIGEAVLSEMVLEMLLPAVLRKVEIGTRDSNGDAIACPACGEKMLAFTMLRVRFERCAKGHGVWFDRDELAAVLRIVGEGAAPAGSPEPAVVLSPSQPLPASPLPLAARKRELVFQIETPGDVVREARSGESIIKIGRLRSCHVHVPNDERVTRLHALIDLDGPPTLVDLGSTDGTLVHGARINKHLLESGDQFVIGATTITVTF